MELQRIVWSWEMIARLLAENDPGIGRALLRSCRPIAAQRYRDGRLNVVLGCWWQKDKLQLEREPQHSRLNDSLGQMLSEKVVTTIAVWPGGMAVAQPASEDEEIPSPDILEGLPQDVREEAAKCESAIQRLFYARAFKRGLRLRCQHPILHYRLDFALPERKIGSDIISWDWRSGGAQERNERQVRLEEQGWQLIAFSGSQVLADVERCVNQLMGFTKTTFDPGQKPLPTRYPSQPRKPFSSIGTNRPPSRDPRRPTR